MRDSVRKKDKRKSPREEVTLGVTLVRLAFNDGQVGTAPIDSMFFQISCHSFDCKTSIDHYAAGCRAHELGNSSHLEQIAMYLASGNMARSRTGCLRFCDA